MDLFTGVTVLSREGNMWDVYDEADLFLITANSFVKQDGRLVMGAGIAKEALARFPSIDLRLGQSIQFEDKHLGVYGLLVSFNWEFGQKLGLFQTKRSYKDDANLSIIEKSTDALIDWCKYHPDAKVHLNFPGIGYGHLKPASVIPIIVWLPDSVSVWRRD
jgi:hypothetical protein